MNTQKQLAFPEYRCACGKLLFKGMLMLSQLEIKCRYCGSLRVIGEKYEELSKNQYAFLAAISTEDAGKDDPSPYIVDVADSALDILGWKREELIGREVKSLDPLMASDAYGNLWKLIVARKFQPLTLDVYQPKKGGGFVKSRARTIFQHAKDTIYLLTIFDLLENPSVPKALPLDTIEVEKIFCPFVLEINRDGICDTVSYEFASLLGYVMTEIINRPLTNLYPKNMVSKHAEYLHEMIDSRTSFRIAKNVFESKNGQKHSFDTFFTIRYGDNGIFNGFTVTLWPATSPSHP